MDLGLDARIVVATDDARVGEAVAGLAVDALVTVGVARSGTERVARVLEHPAYRGYDTVVNVQGDEPLIDRATVLGALERVTRDGDDVGTGAAPLARSEFANPNRVKVAVDGRSRALAFFRTPGAPACARHDATFRHVGVYAYRAAALRRWLALPPAPGEGDEGLEQLRPLAHGMRIGVAVQEEPAAPGVDTEADILEVEAQLAARLTPGEIPGFTGERG
jgi:3-deoxy-manno-octulosonate cytidylyltransferase (CMP-KDO synthetase)